MTHHYVNITRMDGHNSSEIYFINCILIWIIITIYRLEPENVWLLLKIFEHFETLLQNFTWISRWKIQGQFSSVKNGNSFFLEENITQTPYAPKKNIRSPYSDL
jgi:hypothetical protein